MMVDLHSHLLANVDDGSTSLEQSADVLALFLEHGVTDVVLTPHVRASQIARSGEQQIERRDQALAALRSAAPAGVQLHPGFEIMLDEPLPEMAQGDRRFALAGSRYYLVEFPLAIVGELAGGVLQQLAQVGIIPLVAHPERYTQCSVEGVAGWRRAGTRVQVDATTLTRKTMRGRRARALVAAGLADVLAADNHGDRRTLKTAVEFLEARDGGTALSLLTGENPQAVLRDEAMGDVPPVRLREKWMERMRRWIDP